LNNPADILATEGFHVMRLALFRNRINEILGIHHPVSGVAKRYTVGANFTEPNVKETAL
jgi:hypothetical protein